MPVGRLDAIDCLALAGGVSPGEGSCSRASEWSCDVKMTAG